MAFKVVYSTHELAATMTEVAVASGAVAVAGSTASRDAAPNEIRVGQKRAEAYVKIAEQLFLVHHDIVLCGLGNSTLPPTLHSNSIASQPADFFIHCSSSLWSEERERERRV